jgi:hypothetical protein
MRAAKLILVFIAVFLVSSCAVSPRRFESQQWNSGDKQMGGGMAQDLIGRAILDGKSRDEVRQLLGKPNAEEVDWYAYDVITVGRCRFWRCFLNVNFDAKSHRV